jgi:hypothetical protein
MPATTPSSGTEPDDQLVLFGPPQPIRVRAELWRVWLDDPVVVSRFEAKRYLLRSAHTCWIWTAGISSTGHGSFRAASLPGRSRRGTVPAHLFAYQLEHGVIPRLGWPGSDDPCVCHRCDEAGCVNPPTCAWAPPRRTGQSGHNAAATQVIDELHHVLAGRGDTRREFLNLLRFLGNELRIPLVGVGTREAYLAIRSDDQLANRFQPFTLPRWQPDEDACSLLASFAAAFPLRRPSYIASPEMASYLLTRSEGTIGELAHLLTDAAVAAIESGEEAINQRTLLMADYAGPSERRRLFERELA